MKIIMNNVNIVNKVPTTYTFVKSNTITLSTAGSSTPIIDSGVDEEGVYKFVITSDTKVYFIGFRSRYNNKEYWITPGYNGYIEANTQTEYKGEMAAEAVDYFTHNIEFVLPAAATGTINVTIDVYKADD